MKCSEPIRASSKLTTKGSAVVAIGVGRRSVGRDNSSLHPSTSRLRASGHYTSARESSVCQAAYVNMTCRSHEIRDDHLH
jgi:hypothetical protein